MRDEEIFLNDCKPVYNRSRIFPKSSAKIQQIFEISKFLDTVLAEKYILGAFLGGNRRLDY